MPKRQSTLLMLLLALASLVGCGAPVDDAELNLGTSEQALSGPTGWGWSLNADFSRTQCNVNNAVDCYFPNDFQIYYPASVLPGAYQNAANTVAVTFAGLSGVSYDIFSASIPPPGLYDGNIIVNNALPGAVGVGTLPVLSVLKFFCSTAQAPQSPEAFAATFRRCNSFGVSIAPQKLDDWMALNSITNPTTQQNYRVQLMAHLFGGLAGIAHSSLLGAMRQSFVTSVPFPNYEAVDIDRLQNGNPLGGGATFF